MENREKRQHGINQKYQKIQDFSEDLIEDVYLKIFTEYCESFMEKMVSKK